MTDREQAVDVRSQASGSIAQGDRAVAHWDEVDSVGTADFGLPHPSGTRFRGSVCGKRAGYGAALRRLTDTLLTFDDIGPPSGVVDPLAMFRLDDHRLGLVKARSPQTRRPAATTGDSPLRPPTRRSRLR